MLYRMLYYMIVCSILFYEPLFLLCIWLSFDVPFVYVLERTEMYGTLLIELRIHTLLCRMCLKKRKLYNKIHGQTLHGQPICVLIIRLLVSHCCFDKFYRNRWNAFNCLFVCLQSRSLVWNQLTRTSRWFSEQMPTLFVCTLGDYVKTKL